MSFASTRAAGGAADRGLRRGFPKLIFVKGFSKIVVRRPLAPGHCHGNAMFAQIASLSHVAIAGMCQARSAHRQPNSVRVCSGNRRAYAARCERQLLDPALLEVLQAPFERAFASHVA